MGTMLQTKNSEDGKEEEIKDGMEKDEEEEGGEDEAGADTSDNMEDDAEGLDEGSAGRRGSMGDLEVAELERDAMEEGGSDPGAPTSPAEHTNGDSVQHSDTAEDTLSKDCDSDGGGAALAHPLNALLCYAGGISGTKFTNTSSASFDEPDGKDKHAEKRKREAALSPVAAEYRCSPIKKTMLRKVKEELAGDKVLSAAYQLSKKARREEKISSDAKDKTSFSHLYSHAGYSPISELKRKVLPPLEVPLNPSKKLSSRSPPNPPMVSPGGDKGSYQPLKAVQDMVKAAERNSPLIGSMGRSELPYHHSSYLAAARAAAAASQSPGRRDSQRHLESPDRRQSTHKTGQAKDSHSSSSSMFSYIMPQEPPPPPDPEMPLDLSAKPKKAVSPKLTKTGSPGSYVSPFSLGGDLHPAVPAAAASSSSSSLANLERSFGENSSMFDRIGAKNNQQPTPMRHFYLSAFGVGLYSTALNSTQHQALYTQPLLSSVSNNSTSPYETNNSKLSPYMQYSCSGSSHTATQSMAGTSSRQRDMQNAPNIHSTSPELHRKPSPASSSASSSKDHDLAAAVSAASSKEAAILAAMATSSLSETRRHTSLQCSCGSDFETLYELTMHLQETGHPANKTKNRAQHEFPKLVRGQDMWLNQGTEQTRQILRCMQCGESFKSLPELTVHMIQTKHYANIVGVDAQSAAAAVASAGPHIQSPTGSSSAGDNSAGGGVDPGKVSPKSSSSRPIVNYSDSSDNDSVAGVKCKLCGDLFDDLPALSVHIEKCLPERYEQTYRTSSCSPHLSPKRGMADEKDTRSVPYKRRMLKNYSQKVELKKCEDSSDSSNHSFSVPENSRIRCENCAEKIDTDKFVEHVRRCVHYKGYTAEDLRSTGHHDSKDRSPLPVFKASPYKELFNGEVRVKKEKDEYESGSRAMEADSSQSMYKPLVHSSTELVSPPAATAGSGSALKAMESFIESFSGSSSRKVPGNAGFFGAQPFRRNLFGGDDRGGGPGRFGLPPGPGSLQVNLPPSHTPPASSSSGPPTPTPNANPSPSAAASSHLYQNKYLPPLYAATAERTRTRSASPNPVIKKEPVSKEQEPKNCCSTSPEGSPLPDSPSKARGVGTRAEEGVINPKEIPETDRPASSGNSEREDGGEARPVARCPPRKLQEKYLKCDPPPPAPESKKRDTPSSSKAAGSALESLQGLVYGKSFNTEHPLDSLQKLIHTTNNNNNNPHLPKSLGSPGSAVSAATAMQTSLAGTVILVNPIVTVMANTNGGSPSVKITLPHDHDGDHHLDHDDRHDVHPPLNGNHDDSDRDPSDLLNDRDSLSPGSLKESRSHPGSPSFACDRRSPMSDPGDTDQPGDYRCQACNRSFATKGAYRYHLSRCHWSTVKKYGIKDAISTTPYVYLPLDHSAKFNKYYQMANELANKSK